MSHSSPPVGSVSSTSASSTGCPPPPLTSLASKTAAIALPAIAHQVTLFAIPVTMTLTGHTTPLDLLREPTEGSAKERAQLVAQMAEILIQDAAKTNPVLKKELTEITNSPEKKLAFLQRLKIRQTSPCHYKIELNFADSSVRPIIIDIDSSRILGGKDSSKLVGQWTSIADTNRALLPDAFSTASILEDAKKAHWVAERIFQPRGAIPVKAAPPSPGTPASPPNFPPPVPLPSPFQSNEDDTLQQTLASLTEENARLRRTNDLLEAKNNLRPTAQSSTDTGKTTSQAAEQAAEIQRLREALATKNEETKRLQAELQAAQKQAPRTPLSGSPSMDVSSSGWNPPEQSAAEALRERIKVLEKEKKELADKNQALARRLELKHR